MRWDLMPLCIRAGRDGKVMESPTFLRLHPLLQSSPFYSFPSWKPSCVDDLDSGQITLAIVWRLGEICWSVFSWKVSFRRCYSSLSISSNITAYCNMIYYSYNVEWICDTILARIFTARISCRLTRILCSANRVFSGTRRFPTSETSEALWGSNDELNCWFEGLTITWVFIPSQWLFID